MRSVPGGKYDWTCVPEQWPRKLEQRVKVHPESVALTDEMDNWEPGVKGDFADKRAQLHVDTLQYVPKVMTNRPRSIGLRVSYDIQ